MRVRRCMATADLDGVLSVEMHSVLLWMQKARRSAPSDYRRKSSSATTTSAATRTRTGICINLLKLEGTHFLPPSARRSSNRLMYAALLTHPRLGVATQFSMLLHVAHRACMPERYRLSFRPERTT